METYNDCYKIVHISNEITLQEKVFVPRVPSQIAKNEDVTQKRVCFAKTLQGALGGIPYKGEIAKDVMFKDFAYLTVYETDKRKVKHKPTEEIEHLVPDAHLTGECWVTEEITLKPRIIKVTELQLDGGDSCSCSGFVKQLSYETSVSEKAREEVIECVGKPFKRKAIKWAKDNNIPYIILEENMGSLFHQRFALNKQGVYSGTSKNYQISKIKFEVPAHVDVEGLWLIHAENRAYLKKANLEPFIMKKANDEQWDDEDWVLCYQDYLEELALKKKKKLKAV